MWWSGRWPLAPRALEMAGRRSGAGRPPDSAGFTLVELLIVITIGAVMLAVGVTGFRQFTEAQTVAKATRVIAGDVTLTRSYAIRTRGNVSMVLDEANRAYVIRSSDGTVHARQAYDADSDLPLTLLEIPGAEDSITFNSRGLLVIGDDVYIELGRFERSRRIEFNALGRTRVVNP